MLSVLKHPSGGALESPGLIGAAALAAGIATGIFIAMKKEINSNYMTRFC
jgi:hypothetical protein